MTTTAIPFTPSGITTPPFETTVALDGVTYTLSTAWNFYGSWWYFSLTDQGGNLLITAPLVGSTSTFTVPLAPGLFTSSSLAYYPETATIVVTTA